MQELFSADEKYMYRSIRLAENGRGLVGGNPVVGAVIVSGGLVIGEGYHRQYGGPHAEVNAVNAVKDPALLKSSTLYVTLEPCSHYGKTPPCADMISEKGISRVVIGCVDPFPEVCGKGIEKLERAGVEVVAGVLEKECRELIRKFATFHLLKRPYVLLKWAESADGFIDVRRSGGSAVKISDSRSIMYAHKKRAESDAVLVGTVTAAMDDPSLTVREWYGSPPVRIVLDRELKLDNHLRLFDGSNSTLVVTDQPAPEPSQKGVEYLRPDWAAGVLPGLLQLLYRRNIHTLLVEGGSRLLQSFIDHSLWDEAVVEQAGIRLEEGVVAPRLDNRFLVKTEKHFNSCFRFYRKAHF